MRFVAIGVLAAALIPFAAQARGPCRLEQARYALRGAPGVTARFQDIPRDPHGLTDVSLRIDFAKEGDSFWWLFDRGSARFLNMISTTDINSPGWVAPSDATADRKPLADTHVWFATRDYRLNDRLPKSRQAAPPHILIPDLEDVMWYRAEPRRGVPTAFFDLVGCK